jgi:hypothetical protein
MKKGDPEVYAKYLNSVALLKSHGYSPEYIRVKLRNTTDEFVGGSEDGTWNGISREDRIAFRPYLYQSDSMLNPSEIYSPKNLNDREINEYSQGKAGVRLQTKIANGEGSYGDYMAFLLPSSGIDSAFKWGAAIVGITLGTASMAIEGAGGPSVTAQRPITVANDLVQLDRIPALNLVLAGMPWTSTRPPSSEILSPTFGKWLVENDLANIDNKRGKPQINNAAAYYFWNYTSGGRSIAEFDKTFALFELMTKSGYDPNSKEMKEVAKWLSMWIGQQNVAIDQADVIQQKSFKAKGQQDLHGLGESRNVVDLPGQEEKPKQKEIDL